MQFLGNMIRRIITFKTNSSMHHVMSRLELRHLLLYQRHHHLPLHSHPGQNLLLNGGAAVYKASPLLGAGENPTGSSNKEQGQKKQTKGGSHRAWSVSCGITAQLASHFIRYSLCGHMKTWISSAEGGEGENV